MAVLKPLYGTADQLITCTYASLANAAYRQSLAISNAVNLYLDALVTVKATAAASGVTALIGTVAVYAYASTDGSTYDGGCSGADAAYTPPVAPINLVLVGILNLNTANAVDQRTFAIAQAFGGQLPAAWGIVLFNNTGAALAAAGCSAWYQGIQGQAA